MRLENRVTGKVLQVADDRLEKSRYRLKRACRALDRLLGLFGLQLYFLTLTLTDKDVEALNREVRKFAHWMQQYFRRAGVPMFYVWVVELQKKRYRRYGVLALHWHFAIVCRKGALPHVGYGDPVGKRRMRVIRDGDVVSNRMLMKRWGRGMTWCVEGWSRVYDYLEKYIEKGYEGLAGYKKEWAGLRRFGSSRLGKYAYPKWAFEAVNRVEAEYPELADLCLRRVGGRVGWYGVGEIGVDDLREGDKRLAGAFELRSPWRKVEELGGFDSDKGIVV
jgi:hypothetical protein